MNNQHGFTLLEIIAALVLVGIMATTAGLGVVVATRGYLFAKDNSATSQKANLALSRLNRELQELISIPGTMSSNAQGTALMYTRLSAGVSTNFSVGLVGRQIRIRSGAVNLNDYTTGDTLVDNVSSFSLSYFNGSTVWDKIDIRGLSTIRIDLTLSQPGGGDPAPFFTTVNPRNNNNTGGAAPPSGGATLPGGGCFIVTDVFGNGNHPMVLFLRQFRDQVLSRSTPGRCLVGLYYRMSPSLSEFLRGRPAARSMARILLLPVGGAAFILLHTPGWAVPVPFIVVFFCVPWLVRKRRRRLPFATPPDFFPASCQRGAILIWVIIVMVLLAVLGTALTYLLPSASMSQVGSNFAQRAYYLAESGFRYAASEFRAAANTAKEDMLKNSLDGRTFVLSDNDGRFTLGIFPFYHRATQAYAVGATQVATEVPGTIPAELDARYGTSQSGRLKIGGAVYSYSATAHVAGLRNVTFTLATPLTSAVTNLQTIAAAAQRTTNTTTAITLESNASGAFPLLNGTFRIEGLAAPNTNRIWAYTRRSGNILEGIAALDDPSVNLSGITIGATNYVVLEKFVKILSTGIIAQGPNLEARREILYNTPIGAVGSGMVAGKTSKVETFDSMTNWPTGSGESIGTHEIVDGALDVTAAERFGAFDSRQWWSAVAFNWDQAGVDLANAWWSAGRTLSTDLQVKVRVTSQPVFFMPGIGFKAKNYQSGGDDVVDTYGVSFVRGMQRRGWLFFTWGPWENDYLLTDVDGIPDELVPGALFFGSLHVVSEGLTQRRYSQPAIVLWKSTANNFQWLAYRILTSADYAVIDTGSNNLNLKEWSTLQVRAVEAYPMSFDQGGPTPFLYGDTVRVVRGGATVATVRINGSPILTNANWSTSQAAGTLLLSNVDTTVSFQSGDRLYVNNVNRGRVLTTGTLSGQKRNYIKVYYADTDAHGTTNAVATDNNRGAGPRNSVYWPVDDISSWAPANDRMTLVEWANDVQGGVQLRSSAGEGTHIVISDTSFLTPDTGNIIDRAGIYLYTTGGDDLSSYNPPIQFDDFAIQWEGLYGSGGGTGFLPPLQQ